MGKYKKVYAFFLDNFIWMMLLVLFIIASLFVPKFFSVKNISNILYQCASFSLMVLAMTFSLIAGQFDLSIESTFAIGPAIAALLMVDWARIDPMLAIFITLAVGALVGAINGFMSARLGINPFLQTLCMLIILRGIVLYFIPQGLFEIPEPYLFLGEYTLPGTRFPISILVFLLIFVISHLVITRTVFGKNLVATGSNPKAAFIAGIDTKKIKFIVFIISGVLAAVGGLLLAGRMGSVTNSMGEDEVLNVFAATVLGGVSLSGGRGSVFGALGGVLFLQIISNVLNLSGVSPFLVKTITGLMLLGGVIIENFRMKALEKII